MGYWWNFQHYPTWQKYDLKLSYDNDFEFLTNLSPKKKKKSKSNLFLELNTDLIHFFIMSVKIDINDSDIN